MPRYVDTECDEVTETIGRRSFKSREDIRDFLDNIPTAADVVKVVRCKDCLHFCRNGYCGRYEYADVVIPVDYSDYCSYVELRDEK